MNLNEMFDKIRGGVTKYLLNLKLSTFASLLALFFLTGATDDYYDDFNDLMFSSEPKDNPFEIECYQYLKYSSVLSNLDIYRKPARLYLQQEMKKINDFDYFFRNSIYLPFACVSLLDIFSEKDFLDLGFFNSISPEHMTLSQLYAINSSVFKTFCIDKWDFECIFNLPVSYFPLIPSDAINELRDLDVAYKLLYKFNAASYRLLTAQKIRLVRKVMGVALKKLLKHSLNVQDKSYAFTDFIPSADILSLIPFNYFRYLNQTELLLLVYNAPLNSPQTLLLSHLLSNTQILDEVFLNFKVALSLSCHIILKLQISAIPSLLKIYSTMPEPYTLNYETLKCLHIRFVEYLNETYDRTASNEKELVNLVSNDELLRAGGLLLAYFKVESWSSLTKERCVKLISAIGSVSIERLMMIQPSHLLLDITEFAVRRLRFDNLSHPLSEQIALNLGNLINYISPKYIDELDKSVFEIAITKLNGFKFVNDLNAVFAFPCHDDLFVHTLNKNLINLYGTPSNWTIGIISKIGCLLYVLDNSQLAQIKNKYLVENVDIVRTCWNGIENNLDYVQIKTLYNGLCRQNLGKFYYTRQLKIKNVIKRFKNAVLQEISFQSVSIINGLQSTNVMKEKANFSNICFNLCPALQDIGSIEYWDYNEIDKLREIDFHNCLDFMGTRFLQDDIAETVWQQLIKALGPSKSIKKQILMQLGSLVRGIQNDFFANLKLNDADILGEFGRIDLWSSKDIAKLKSIAIQVKKQYKKKIESYTSWDFMILGQIICGFHINDLIKICNLTIADAIAILSQLDCPEEVMKLFASKIVNKNLFGPPSLWGPGILKAVGTILNGLSSIELRSIPPCAFFGISIRAASIFPAAKFNQLSKMQLFSFPCEVIVALQLFGTFELLDIEVKTIFQLILYNQRSITNQNVGECVDLNWEVFRGSIHGDERDIRCLNEGSISFSSRPKPNILCSWAILLAVCFVMNVVLC